MNCNLYKPTISVTIAIFTAYNSGLKMSSCSCYHWDWSTACLDTTYDMVADETQLSTYACFWSIWSNDWQQFRHDFSLLTLEMPGIEPGICMQSMWSTPDPWLVHSSKEIIINTSYILCIVTLAVVFCPVTYNLYRFFQMTECFTIATQHYEFL